jgi:hypothetical protein
MKKMIFVAGLVSGVVIAQNWKGLSKGGIKAGIKAGRKLREISQKALEDIEDLTAEAVEELSEQDEEQVA